MQCWSAEPEAHNLLDVCEKCAGVGEKGAGQLTAVVYKGGGAASGPHSRTPCPASAPTPAPLLEEAVPTTMHPLFLGCSSPHHPLPCSCHTANQCTQRPAPSPPSPRTCASVTSNAGHFLDSVISKPSIMEPRMRSSSLNRKRSWRQDTLA